MNKHNQEGTITLPAILAVVFGLLFVFAAIFGVWAFMGRQDYKQNVDEKIKVAVEVAKQETSSLKDNEFLEREKLPTKQFKGDDALGGLQFAYPKTWSVYVDTSSNSEPLNGILHPYFVPAVDRSNPVSYALRVQVINREYAEELESLQNDIERGTLRATPFKAAKVDTFPGMRLDGQIEKDKPGIIVLLPVRDKTIKIWTEGTSYAGDFNSIILPSLDYQP